MISENFKREFLKEEPSADEFLKNEYRTNKAISICLLGFVVLGIINDALLGYDALQQQYLYRCLFIPINSLLVLMVLISAIYRFEKRWIKYMLLIGIILASTAAFFAFTIYTLYLILVPIFISARYFDRKLIVYVSAITAGLFLIACILNVALEPVSETVRLLHQNALFNTWTRFFDAAAYITIPCLLAMVILSVFAVNMTASGGRLIASKVKSTQIIAAVDAEINTAAHIQKSVLPSQEFTSSDGNFELYAYESPAKEVCGDFYDYFMLNDNILAVIVADVSDKGIPAAMFMMSAKKVLQCAILSRNSLEEAIELANRLICNDNKSDMFLTLWMGLIDTRSGIGKYVNAGHPYPLIRHADGSVGFIENEPDLFIGNFPERTPAVHTLRMKPGDTLVIYTDGLTDAADENGKPFTADRIREQLTVGDFSAAQTSDRIVNAVHSFSETSHPFDDIKVTVLRCNNLSSPTELKLSVKIGIEGTALISNTVLNALKACACPDDKRRSICVAVDEICHNISEYAYSADGGDIIFSALIFDNCLEMTFQDNGIPFNPLNYETVPSDVLQIGGLGISLVKQLADSISYDYADGQNRLSMLFIWKI